VPRVVPENSILPPSPHPHAGRGKHSALPEGTSQPFSMLLDKPAAQDAAPGHFSANRRDAADRSQATTAKCHDRPSGKPATVKPQQGCTTKPGKAKADRDSEAAVPAASPQGAGDGAVAADTADADARGTDPLLGSQPQQSASNPAVMPIVAPVISVPDPAAQPAPGPGGIDSAGVITVSNGASTDADLFGTRIGGADPNTAAEPGVPVGEIPDAAPEVKTVTLAAAPVKTAAPGFSAPDEDATAQTAADLKPPVAAKANVKAGEAKADAAGKAEPAGDQAAPAKTAHADPRPDLPALPSEANNAQHSNFNPAAPLHQASLAATDVSAAANAQPAAPANASLMAVPVSGLAVEIAARAQTGKNRFEIRLDPPELGRIDVRLNVDRHGNVTSHLIVDRSETLDLLRRDAPNLDRAFQDAGLKTSDNGTQYSLRDQSFSQHGSDERETPVMARLMVMEDQLYAAEAMQRNYGRLAGLRGGIDIRV
jgi:flagellar hook-length control protein FliK